MAEGDGPYVVLLGAVGSGKSTIVEKLTGKDKNSIASNAGTSDTRCSNPLWTLRGEFIISDTPGSNAMGDKFNHNLWIAVAFNYRPVAKIFIVVKADVGRMDGVIASIREYSDRFINLLDVPLGVLVTHMDKVPWEASEDGHESDFRRFIEDELDINDVVFSETDTPGNMLVNNILSVCNQPFNITVDHENFLKLFTKIHKSKRADTDILRHCQREVEDFKNKREQFNKNRNNFDEKVQVDLVFEFQAFMNLEITEAQRKMADKFSFKFDGPEADNEAAHIGNMSNHIMSELRAIRIETLAFQNNHGLCTLRKCQHCGQVWTKVEGCEAETICGERPSTANDMRDPSYTVMATFTFRWDEITKELDITKTGTKSAQPMEASGPKFGIGCGKPITWHQMPNVVVPAEFTPTAESVAMTDVQMLPPSATSFNSKLDDRMNTNLSKMKLGPKPKPETETETETETRNQDETDSEDDDDDDDGDDDADGDGGNGDGDGGEDEEN